MYRKQFRENTLISPSPGEKAVISFANYCSISRITCHDDDDDGNDDDDQEKFAPLEAIRIELRAEIMCKGVACDR